MNDNIRALFPAASNYTYLNSAAVSPLPTVSIDAIRKQLEDVSNHGALNYSDWVETKDRARKRVAAMLNVKNEQIAFTRNTSDGFASIANGLEWQKGDNIVSFEREFPANFYPWRRVRDEFGVELKLCEELDGRIDLDQFVSLIDSKTKVVTISSVQYASGFRSDLARIGEAARRVDALFCVDIIQGLGAEGYDLPAMLVDAAAGASHKWLCAPEGCGILYLSDRARDRVKPTLTGWISVETPWDFEDREQPLKSTALAWESGTGCSSLFYGLDESLRLLSETGLDKISPHLESLTDQLCESIPQDTYEIVSSRAEGEKSPIVCIRHRGDISSSDAAQHLLNEKIVISPRGDRIRIAPHFYNNADDIERLIACLP
ncbi:MAG: aminotransferase class V-fold PLP-dependent enzyme [Pyrinomonadaceae bacterium]